MVDISSILGDNEILIELGGDINSYDVEGIRERIEREVSLYSDKREVIVDMQTVRFSNHNFPSFLYLYNEELRRDGKKLIVRNLEPQLYGMFRDCYGKLFDKDSPQITKTKFCFREDL